MLLNPFQLGGTGARILPPARVREDGLSRFVEEHQKVQQRSGLQERSTHTWLHSWGLSFWAKPGERSLATLKEDIFAVPEKAPTSSTMASCFLFVIHAPSLSLFLSFSSIKMTLLKRKMKLIVGGILSLKPETVGTILLACVFYCLFPCIFVEKGNFTDVRP